MPDPMNRLDHFVWVVRPENIKNYVDQLSALFDIEFDYRDGPRNDRSPVQTYVSWTSGLELIAPFPDPDARAIEDHPVSKALVAHLEEHGEGPFGVVVRVADIEASTERMRALGYDIEPVAPPADPEAKRAALAEWTSNVFNLKESFVAPFLGTWLTIGQMDYPDEIEKPSS